jgi:ribonuclease HI
MEIMAAIAALEALKTRCRVILYSDSQLLVNAISEGWLRKWKKKGWKRGKKWVQNADLWQQLDRLCAEHEVTFEWVKGHAGNVGNERADTLSMQAAMGPNLEVDSAYEEGETQLKPPTLFSEL